MKWYSLLVVSALLITAHAKSRGFGPQKQDYDYVTVRDGAHMFWWLYHTTADVIVSSQRPLILWLQGGPGAASSGFGNFGLIGPLDLNLDARTTTWITDFNVLFVDNPVGTGYSYVDDLSSLATDNKQIATDLVTLMKGFYDKMPQFKNCPLYIYGQQYGGKMAVEFAKMLYDESKLGNVQANVSGVAMVDSWISPVDSALSWAPYLYQVSLVDENGEADILSQAQRTKELFDQGQYQQSTEEWTKTEDLITEKTDGADFYNILTKVEQKIVDNKRSIRQRAIDRHTLSKYYSPRYYDLDILMNNIVKSEIDVPSSVTWGSQADNVFDHLKGDFMKPVIDIVESILSDTTLTVHVYNGNMDLMADTPGQMAWISKMQWKDSAAFKSAERQPIWVNNTMEGYQKQGGKFTMFWINVAGHSVTADNPAATRVFLKSMTGY